MFACIFIPDFSVQAIIRFEPELRARSLAVLTGQSPLEKVSALNERARQSGVEVGATKSQLEAWDNLVLRARSESQETSAHAALLDCAQSFSPEVEDSSPGTVLLNLAGLEPLFGPLPKIARDLARRVSQMRLEANIAVAPNPDAALLAARGFPGVALIPEGREAERLGDLPVDVLLESFSSDLEEAARWVKTFDRWGIRKLRALATLPEVPLSERLGQPGVRLQKLARGAASRNLSVLEPRLIFAESVELEYPIVLLEPLAFLLNRMLEQVCARLGARALAVQELQLNLELAATQQNGCASFTCTPSRKFTRTLRLPTPMLDQMSAVIAFRLFRPPLGASVTLREAKPVRMRCLQREDIAGEIVWTAGPWRSSGDWSEQEGWSREEWDIAVPADNALVLYRLVQDKLSGNWFVEGTYD